MVLVASALWVPCIPREPLEEKAHTALNTNALQTVMDSIFRLSLEAPLSLAQAPADNQLTDTMVPLPAPNQTNIVLVPARSTAEEDAWVKEPARTVNAPVSQVGEALIAVRELDQDWLKAPHLPITTFHQHWLMITSQLKKTTLFLLLLLLQKQLPLISQIKRVLTLIKYEVAI
jgi:hypothetical protein